MVVNDKAIFQDFSFRKALNAKPEGDASEKGGIFVEPNYML